MRRLVVSILLALFLGQAFAAPHVAVLEVCSATCADDGSDGQCGPICVDCGCCSHAMRSLIVDPGASELPARATRFDGRGGDRCLPAAAARDVFHVPRLHLV